MQHATETLFKFQDTWTRWSTLTEIKRGCQWLQFKERSPTRRPESTTMCGMQDFDVTIMDLPDFEWPAWSSRTTITSLFTGKAIAMHKADQTVDREFALKVGTECTVCHETCNNAFVTCGYCMNQLHDTCLTDYRAIAGDSSKKCPTCRNVVF